MTLSGLRGKKRVKEGKQEWAANRRCRQAALPPNGIAFISIRRRRQGELRRFYFYKEKRKLTEKSHIDWLCFHCIFPCANDNFLRLTKEKTRAP